MNAFKTSTIRLRHTTTNIKYVGPQHILMRGPLRPYFGILQILLMIFMYCYTTTTAVLHDLHVLLYYCTTIHDLHIIQILLLSTATAAATATLNHGYHAGLECAEARYLYMIFSNYT